MQDLWHAGTHARAFARGKHDGQAGSSGHPNPSWKMMGTSTS
jgi:hypothetical protein